jgi:AGCS family alanine or glycine:cation symporter
MELINTIIGTLDTWVWGPWFIVLLFGTHIFMTIRTGVIQKKLGLGIKLSVTKDPDGSGDVSQFGALATALASTIGTGNIVGVGTAIASGGPGAVLWMWLSGLFGIATKYSESLIAVKYRVKDEKGAMLGGAMYALERGVHAKWLGVIFAFLASICAFGIGAGVQSNAVANLVQETGQRYFNITIATWIPGIIITILVAIVIIGGLKVITRVCEGLVPFMAAFYVVGCIVLLFINHAYLGRAVVIICTMAFNPQAVGGGLAGFFMKQAVQYGIARGLFSNESGMGSAPIVASAAKTRNPVRQALVSSTGTFWDTVVICLLTGLVVVSSIANPNNGIDLQHFNGSTLVNAAFGQLGIVGVLVLTIGLFTFAFSTILGWSYYGEQCAEYLWGIKSNYFYRVIYCAFVMLGTLAGLDLVWKIADILNALMALPNIIAVLALSSVVAAETRKYLKTGSIEDRDTEEVPLRSELRKK